MKKSIFQENRSRVCGLVLLAVISVFGITSCKTDFDLDKRTPEWLGPSIYDYLKNNHFDTYVKLIEDLNYKDVLSKTGSKTLFVADEDAVKRFYESGVFKKADGTPVSRYEDLSIGQKKMILYGSMLNNVYQVAMLSSTEGPTIGDCMRRLTSSSEFDNVPMMKVEEMPALKNEAGALVRSQFSYYIENNKNIRIMRDASIKPMILMNHKFMLTHKMTKEDYDFLFNNNEDKYDPEDASVNGINISAQNIKCLNGFVHKMEEVIYTLPNMAEHLEQDDLASIYYSLLSRFCAPFALISAQGGDRPIAEAYDQYIINNQLDTIMLNGVPEFPTLLGTQDSLFELRYFSSSRRYRRNTSIVTPGGENVSSLELAFDPGWNGYYSASTTTSLQKDMSVMLVPTNEALMEWWERGAGKPLKERYGLLGRPCYTFDDVILDMNGLEDHVIIKLINNNMLSSFTSSVPSKFADVLNDAQDPMGLMLSDIDKVSICCNGAIYYTNRVMSPTAYRSVSFPTLVNENLRVINWAVGDWIGGREKGCGFFAYLNSMSTKYSFFVPVSNIINDPNAPQDNQGRLIFIDPVSFGSLTTDAFVFRYDYTSERVVAEIYTYDVETKQVDWTTGRVANTAEDLGTSKSDQVRDRLIDLLDYHIVIGEIDPEYEYFRTKGNGTIKYEIVGDDILVSGGFQLEQGKPSKVIAVYDLSTDGNGKTYVIDEPLTTSSKSVYDIVSDTVSYPEFREFFKLMSISGIFSNPSGGITFGSEHNVSAFNSYHYTVYIPKSDSIILLYDKNILAADSLIELWNDAYETAVLELAGEDDPTDPTDTDTPPTTPDQVVYKVINKRNSDGTRYTYEQALAEAIADQVPDDTTFVYTDYYDNIIKRTKDFVKYHIQDNSIYIGGQSDSKEYETSYMTPLNIFERINVRTTANSIQITDKKKNVRNVLKSTNSLNKNLYNIMCREYEYKREEGHSMMETSSYAVIHYIDAPLYNGEIDF